MSKKLCSCYKSKKEQHLRCPHYAKSGSIYCGIHVNCRYIFDEQTIVKPTVIQMKSMGLPHVEQHVEQPVKSKIESEIIPINPMSKPKVKPKVKPHVLFTTKLLQSLLIKNVPSTASTVSTSVENTQLIVPHVVNIHKKDLNQRGIRDYNQWVSLSDSLYIGRNLRIGGSNGITVIPKSKWHNPYKLDKNKSNIDQILDQYETHVRSSSLWRDLGELSGKELGCWCHPNPCHGDVLIKLFREKFRI